VRAEEAGPSPSFDQPVGRSATTGGGAGGSTGALGVAAVDPASVRPAGLHWWREALYILAFYGIYTGVRDTQGSAGRGRTAPATDALQHARDVIHIERVLDLFHEQEIQHFFLGHLSSWTAHFFQFWNLWYGSAHFVVTTVVVIWLFRRRPGRYPFWRNTLAATTALALVGFAVFPLMPPRLIHQYLPYDFVDSLARYGGSWSFDSGAMTRISNQFAAMPSLHIAWSSWCACAVFPACRRWWSRALAVAYPIVTLFCIVVTANHYFLDAAGGLVVLAGGAAISRPVTAWMYRRHPALT
jgi:hypothetical protein